MRILVTGASGFIGRFLVSHLLDAGHEVLAIVRSEPQDFPAEAELIHADLKRPDWTDCLDRPVDIVVHLAQSRFYHSFPDGADDMFNVNAQATFALAKWCQANKVRRVVYAGTGSVYKAGAGPFSEGHPVAAASMYAATKLASEHILEQYTNFFDVVICRLFSVYGAGENTMLINRIIKSVAEEREVFLPGGTGPLLSPVHVEDVCAAIGSLLTSPVTDGKTVINIAGDQDASLKEVVDIIAQALDKEPRCTVTDGPVVDIRADGCKVQELLGKMRPLSSLKDVTLQVVQGNRSE